MPICAVPRGRTRRERSFDRAGRLVIGVVQGDRRGILMPPRGQEGIDLQGVERDRTTHAIELRGTQRLERERRHLRSRGSLCPPAKQPAEDGALAGGQRALVHLHRSSWASPWERRRPACSGSGQDGRAPRKRSLHKRS
jgi:hypothetical protein